MVAEKCLFYAPISLFLAQNFFENPALSVFRGNKNLPWYQKLENSSYIGCLSRYPNITKIDDDDFDSLTLKRPGYFVKHKGPRGGLFDTPF